jgi:uncharacterized membrane protein YhaH (DUF805 family)
MGFGQAVATCLAKYATFQGRAHRPEYWFWMLFVILFSIAVWAVALILYAIVGAGIAIIFGVLAFVATILPSIAVAVRRLHDVDRGGGWYFIQLIPAVGPYWFLYYMVQPGTVRDPSPGPNRFGDGLS